MWKGCPLIQAWEDQNEYAPTFGRIAAHHIDRLHDLPCIVIDPVVPIAERKHVVEFDHHGERIELALWQSSSDRAACHSPNHRDSGSRARRGVAGVRGLAVFWTVPAFGTRARCYLDRVNRLSDVTPLLIFTHPAGDHSANAEPMGDDLATLIQRNSERDKDSGRQSAHPCSRSGECRAFPTNPTAGIRLPDARIPGSPWSTIPEAAAGLERDACKEEEPGSFLPEESNRGIQD